MYLFIRCLRHAECQAPCQVRGSGNTKTKETVLPERPWARGQHRDMHCGTCRAGLEGARGGTWVRCCPSFGKG